mmetsp:Transcript_5720/g.12073  ORF Transcript_5720/g.12073 Transcript_5720/m.12073 type:complete len:132 (+) Transcript_5720:201-596(+)
MADMEMIDPLAEEIAAAEEAEMSNKKKKKRDKAKSSATAAAVETEGFRMYIHKEGEDEDRSHLECRFYEQQVRLFSYWGRSSVFYLARSIVVRVASCVGIYGALIASFSRNISNPLASARVRFISTPNWNR